MSGPGCPEARERLSAYLENDLPAGEAAAVRAHLDGCAACRAELDGLRLTLEALRRLPDLPAPAGILAGVRSRLAPKPWWRRLAGRVGRPWLIGVPVGAVAALAVVAAVALFQERFPELRRTEGTLPNAEVGQKAAPQKPPLPAPEAGAPAPASVPAPAPAPAPASRHETAPPPPETAPAPVAALKEIAPVPRPAAPQVALRAEPEAPLTAAAPAAAPAPEAAAPALAPAAGTEPPAYMARNEPVPAPAPPAMAGRMAEAERDAGVAARLPAPPSRRALPPSQPWPQPSQPLPLPSQPARPAFAARAQGGARPVLPSRVSSGTRPQPAEVLYVWSRDGNDPEGMRNIIRREGGDLVGVRALDKKTGRRALLPLQQQMIPASSRVQRAWEIDARVPRGNLDRLADAVGQGARYQLLQRQAPERRAGPAHERQDVRIRLFR